MHGHGRKGFGACARKNCVYRMERCSWGFCRICCSNLHTGRTKHESDEDVAPPGPGYRINQPVIHQGTEPQSRNQDVFQGRPLTPIDSTVVESGPIIGLPVAAPEPTPGTLKPIVTTDWPSDADGGLYGKDRTIGEMVLQHPLFKEDKAR